MGRIVCPAAKNGTKWTLIFKRFSISKYFKSYIFWHVTQFCEYKWNKISGVIISHLLNVKI